MISLDMMIKTASKKLVSYIKNENGKFHCSIGKIHISAEDANEFLKDKNIPLKVWSSAQGIGIEVTTDE
jgi:hypothetical protein